MMRLLDQHELTRAHTSAKKGRRVDYRVSYMCKTVHAVYRSIVPSR